MDGSTRAGEARPRSDVLLDEIRKRQQHGREIVNVDAERVKIVVVVCGGNHYAFYGADIREVLPHCPLWWVPGLPAHLPGLINVRGDVESVVDVACFLGEKRSRDAALVAMAASGDFQAGILIDAIVDVVDIPVSDIVPPLATLSGAAKDLIVGEFDYGGKAVSLLDIARLSVMATV